MFCYGGGEYCVPTEEYWWKFGTCSNHYEWEDGGLARVPDKLEDEDGEYYAVPTEEYWWNSDGVYDGLCSNPYGELMREATSLANARRNEWEEGRFTHVLEKLESAGFYTGDMRWREYVTPPHLLELDEIIAVLEANGDIPRDVRASTRPVHR